MRAPLSYFSSLEHSTRLVVGGREGSIQVACQCAWTCVEQAFRKNDAIELGGYDVVLRHGFGWHGPADLGAFICFVSGYGKLGTKDRGFHPYRPLALLSISPFIPPCPAQEPLLTSILFPRPLPLFVVVPSSILTIVQASETRE